jgi:hypothetical protein
MALGGAEIAVRTRGGSAFSTCHWKIKTLVEKQTELIAEHDSPDNFEGSVILEVRPAFRDEGHFAPLQGLTAIQAFGADNPTTQAWAISGA